MVKLYRKLAILNFFVEIAREQKGEGEQSAEVASIHVTVILCRAGGRGGFSVDDIAISRCH